MGGTAAGRLTATYLETLPRVSARGRRRSEPHPDYAEMPNHNHTLTDPGHSHQLATPNTNGGTTGGNLYGFPNAGGNFGQGGAYVTSQGVTYNTQTGINDRQRRLRQRILDR